MRSEHKGAGDETTRETCQSSPLKRAEEAEPRTIRLPIKWIGFNEQPYPRAIKRRVDYAKNESVKDVTYKRSEQLACRIHRPVQWHLAEEGKKRERRREPPKDRITQSPPHAGAVATNIALEEQAECCSNREGNTELQQHFDGLRLDVAQTGNQREKSTLPHPVPKDQATDYARQATSNDRPAPVKERPGVVWQDSSTNAVDDADWRPEANQRSDQRREAAASIFQHDVGIGDAESQHACGQYEKPE